MSIAVLAGIVFALVAGAVVGLAIYLRSGGDGGD